MGLNIQSRETSAPTAPSAGFMTLYPLGASDTAISYYFKRPDGTVFTLASLEAAQTFSGALTLSATLTAAAINASGLNTTTITSSGSASNPAFRAVPSTGTHYTGFQAGTAFLGGRTTGTDAYFWGNTDGFTYTNTGNATQVGLNNGGFSIVGYVSGSAAAALSTPVTLISATYAGAVTIPGTLAAGATTITGALSASTTIKAGGYTVATLPAGATGLICYVTDQLAAVNAKGAAPTGGGAVVCYQYYNGAAWVGI